METSPSLAVTAEAAGSVVPGGDEAVQAGSGQGQGTRERRSRDRYGRDRRERGERNGGQGRNGEARGDLEVSDADGENQAMSVPAAETAAPVAKTEVNATASTAASAAGSTRLPRVQPYKLPLSSLNEVASAAGLQWVNSDADKVAAVQAAIAAEPQPVHVPRERPAPVVVDEGPLILVETRKDLSELKLPFESQ
ncbi:hypothetical protein P3G55_24665 [Leptospira sp. 96542]|nr:hypothetical protein [Leptospira sp. 96542]